MTFVTKTDLPQKTQDEIDRIQAIASAQRTTTEAALLTSLAPYLTKASASTMTCTAKTKGTVGNAISIAESGSNTSWASGATALSGGVDGTVASEGQIYKDSSYLYVAIAANTVADTNWRRIDLGSAY